MALPKNRSRSSTEEHYSFKQVHQHRMWVGKKLLVGNTSTSQAIQKAMKYPLQITVTNDEGEVPIIASLVRSFVMRRHGESEEKVGWQCVRCCANSNIQTMRGK